MNWSQKNGYYGGIGQTPWYANDILRQQLNLNQTQYEQLNKSYNDTWKQYQQGLEQFKGNSTNPQNAQQLFQLQQKFHDTFANSLNNTITDPALRQRYNQLYWQYRGHGALTDPMLQQKLNLTPEQQRQLQQNGEAWNKQMDALNQQYPTDAQGTLKQFTQMRQQADQQLNKVLTPQQQQSWRQMIGDPYTFQPNMYFQGNIQTGPANTNPANTNPASPNPTNPNPGTGKK